MLKFKQIKNADNWEGVDWRVTSTDGLAELVAKVALGQARQVTKIFQDTNYVAFAPSKTAVDGAIRLLTATNPDKPWHRDGWMFQVLAWIAAHQHSPKTLKAAPHMIHAHKGFDGVHLQVADDGTIASVTICEQKATGNPRKLITSQVWPEFRSLESGKRDNELVAEVTALLEKNGHIDVDQAVSAILWENSRSYSVSITIGDDEHSEHGYKALFKGYKAVAPKRDVQSRRAETFHRKNLRKWMDTLSSKAIEAVRRLEPSDV